MSKAEFVHLHNHSEYSLLDGATPLTSGKGKPSEFMHAMAKMGFKSMGLTDHGNMFGAVEFYKSCHAVGIKPILGMEAYIAPQSRFDKEKTMGAASNHLTLLAANNEGYRNLIKLSTLSYLEGFHYKPRIDKEILAKYSRGLIGFSGCLNGEIPKAIRNEDEKKVDELIDAYVGIFGKENFYFEVMRHELEEQDKLTPHLIELSKKTGIKLVGTNDCHYFKSSHHNAHDILLCVGTGRKQAEEKRLKFTTNHFYYKTQEEMVEVFKDLPQAIESTIEISNKCEIKLQFDQLHLPEFPVPAGESSDSYLEKLCLEGLKKRMGRIPDPYKERLYSEIKIIRKMGFSAYFLIVWDFIRFARKEGIPVGPGRGSGAGSLVAYTLFITSIDPIQNGLLFERFLNPDRRSMPDLDIDFSDDGRDQVIQYVRQKYGENCVAQIITFGSMMARAVVRDVGRVLDMPLPEVDKIAAMIPRELGVTIDSAFKSNPELRQAYKINPEVKKLIDVAKDLEGLKRHTGVHAAGTVIAAGDITDYVPLAKNNKDIVTTQYDGETLSELGLLKVDFLGLRTLTVIRNAVKLVQERHDPHFDIEKIAPDDKKTYALLARADTSGVFQLESGGMRDLLKKLKPNNLSDITALISLYRPGPMGSGMLDEFVQRKSDPSKVKYDHELLKPIIEETYGIIVYQEQVMKISQSLAGYTPGEADGLRKAMGKKIMEVLKRQRGYFVEGCGKNKIPEKIANHIFDLMEHFGGYGFNKSHASAYGLISYQTAFIKANFPVEYMAALCSSEIGRSTMASKEVQSKLVGYLGDIKDMGISVLAPDVQKSGATFTVESPVGSAEPQIRFGLTAVKNVGEGAVQSIISSREKDGFFEGIEDFCLRVDTRLTNRRAVESLIKSGAFDGMMDLPVKQSRPRLLLQVEPALAAGAKMKADQDFAQESLFGELEIKALGRKPTVKVESNAEWTEAELLSKEKEVLGLYLSGHPLARFKHEMASYTTARLGNLPDSGIVRVAGQILSIRRLTTKRGNLMARFLLEDLSGEVEVVVFPKLLTPEINSILEQGMMVVVKGKIEARESNQGIGEKNFLAEEINTFYEARLKFVRDLTLSVKTGNMEDVIFRDLKQLFGKYPGLCRVNLLLKTIKDGNILLETRTGIKPTPEFIKEIEGVLGPECWSFGRVHVQQGSHR